jgi:hypothetical protein
MIIKIWPLNFGHHFNSQEQICATFERFPTIINLDKLNISKQTLFNEYKYLN